MKKLLMAMALLPMMATAETWYDATTSLTWEYCLDGGATMKRQQPAEYGALPPGATIEQVSPSPVGALEIPSSINGYDVVAIDQNFLKQCETITSVSVPSTVREISCYAFYECKNLRDIRLSEGLELIAWKAFNRFKGPSVTLPSTLSVLFTAVLTDASVSQTVTFLGEVPKVVETHGNELVFEGRPNLIVLVPRNKGWDEIVSGGTWQGSLIRYAGTSPQVGLLDVILGEAVSFDTGFIGYTAKGLPSGLKYDKKTGKITASTPLRISGNEWFSVTADSIAYDKKSGMDYEFMLGWDTINPHTGAISVTPDPNADPLTAGPDMHEFELRIEPFE